MAWAFPIARRVGFNLDACEEVLLLWAYKHVARIVADNPQIQIFHDMMFRQAKGVEERAIIVINEAIAANGMARTLRFLPRRSDWGSDYMKTTGPDKIMLRQRIRDRLAGPEADKTLSIARREYAALTASPDPEQEAMFEAALHRIETGTQGFPALSWPEAIRAAGRTEGIPMLAPRQRAAALVLGASLMRRSQPRVAAMAEAEAEGDAAGLGEQPAPPPPLPVALPIRPDEAGPVLVLESPPPTVEPAPVARVTDLAARLAAARRGVREAQDAVREAEDALDRARQDAANLEQELITATRDL